MIAKVAVDVSNCAASSCSVLPELPQRRRFDRRLGPRSARDADLSRAELWPSQYVTEPVIYE